MFDSLAVSTRASYATGVRSYLAFCTQHGYAYERAWPAAWETVCLWMAYLATRVAPSTVRSYVTALNTAHELAGHPMPTRGQDHPLVDRIFRGIKRRHTAEHVKAVRRPIDTALLARIRSVLPLQQSGPVARTARMLYAAMCTGTCGLLRVAEFAHDRSKSHYRTLQLSDLTFICSDGETRFAHVPLHANAGIKYARLFLPASKTDPFRLGVHVLISAPLAINALRSYLLVHPRRTLSTAALFEYASGTALGRSDLIRCMRACITALGLPAAEYAGHSFRRGGASSLAAAGAPPHLIQALGRWTSDCYRLYIELPLDTIAAAARSM